MNLGSKKRCPPADLSIKSLTEFLPASPRTVAAILSPTFFLFSASQGNDLRPLFPFLPRFTNINAAPSPFPACLWCICASRFQQAILASQTHPLGEAIVPRVILESTHEKALQHISMEDLERFANGGAGDGGFGTPGVKVKDRAGR